MLEAQNPLTNLSAIYFSVCAYLRASLTISSTWFYSWHQITPIKGLETGIKRE